MEAMELRADKSRRRKNITKVIVFLLIFVILFFKVSDIMVIDAYNEENQMMTGIYKEKENSLDIVYLGSSNAYSYWNSLLSWGEYGLTSSLLSHSDQPLLIAEYLIKQARRTQPEAVYVVNINTMGENGIDPDADRRSVLMHFMVDTMPISKEKYEFIRFLTDLEGLSFQESLEYYFPLIRFHNRWNQLKTGNFERGKQEGKYGRKTEVYLDRISDITKAYKRSDEKMEISELMTESLESLLDYCDEQQVKIVFVTVPRAEETMELVRKFNTINEMIAQRGYPVLDLIDEPDTLGLNMKTDFSDDFHTNIHGSIKFTRYISEYLIENYGLKNKHGSAEYDSWDKSLESYKAAIAPSLLDFELDRENCDYSIPPIEEISVETGEKGLVMSWKPAADADSYSIYRKCGRNWELVKETEECTFTDEEAASKPDCSYAVVSCRQRNGQKRYGNWYHYSIAAESDG